jgi:Fe-S cluster assembly protein SufD
MPSGREEQWRRTDLGILDLSTLKAADLERARLIGGADRLPPLPEWCQKAVDGFGEPAGVLFQTTKNGGYLKLDSALASKGVIFCDLATAIEKYPQQVQPYLAGSKAAEPGKFNLMTRALFNCGAFLYVPKDVVIEAPFLVGIEFSASQGSEYGGAIFPRLIVVAEDNSKVNLVYLLGSDDGHKSGTNSRVSLASSVGQAFVKSGARLTYLEVQHFDDDVFFIQDFASEVGRDAVFTSLSVGLGGKQTKSDITTCLKAPGAKSDVLGAVLGSGHEKFNFNTIQDHDAPDTNSNINFRVALKDSSESVYQGIIRVDKQAQRTDAYQSNKNLLLGGDAKADSVPKLEILADDVKCSHGATVGPVDKEQLFYLGSRCLPPAQAEELIVLGFFRKVLEQFSMPGASEWLYELLAGKVYASFDKSAAASPSGQPAARKRRLKEADKHTAR